MKVAIFSTQSYDQAFLTDANAGQHELTFFTEHLNKHTVLLARYYDAVCCFVNDDLSADVLNDLAIFGVKLIALRSAGFNHVNLQVAHELGLTVMRVPAYSPHAIAEHAVALLFALNRKICRAYNRIREHDFSLHGLMGFNCHGKTVGIIGLGEIGKVFARIMLGFDTRILVYDPYCQQPDNLNLEMVDLETLYQTSDIISLHCPLTPETHHLIDAKAIAVMKNGMMLINTSRGAIIDTQAVIAALKTQKIAYLGLDVYEEEENLFFEDLSDKVIQDDVFARLQTFPNVIVTGHQAFFTIEAVRNIAQTTINNITAFAAGSHNINIVNHLSIQA